MIISKFFGLILILIGGFLLLISGGCAVLGVHFVISSISSANYDDIIDLWLVALVTLLGLVLGGFLTKYAYRILMRSCSS